MERHRIKRAPVVRDGEVVGIVSRADIVRAFAQQETASKAQSDDATIRNTLLQRLKSQPWAPSSGVNFSISNGVVCLYGLVSSEEQRRALSVMAETIPGVRDVKNETGILPSVAMA